MDESAFAKIRQMNARIDPLRDPADLKEIVESLKELSPDKTASRRYAPF